MKRVSIIIITMMLILNICIIPVNASMNISAITGSSSVPSEVNGTLKEMWSKVFRIFTTIGVGVAIIMLIVVAIKYMSVAPSERAEIKKYLIIYTVGAIFILCCVGIVNLLKGVATEILL